jgi:hypothetical protein
LAASGSFKSYVCEDDQALQLHKETLNLSTRSSREWIRRRGLRGRDAEQENGTDLIGGDALPETSGPERRRFVGQQCLLISSGPLFGPLIDGAGRRFRRRFSTAVRASNEVPDSTAGLQPISIAAVPASIVVPASTA